jgi:hypothetical protein
MITIILNGREDKIDDIQFTYSINGEMKVKQVDNEELWKLLQVGNIDDDSCYVRYNKDIHSIRDIFKNEYDELMVRINN